MFFYFLNKVVFLDFLLKFQRLNGKEMVGNFFFGIIYFLIILIIEVLRHEEFDEGCKGQLAMGSFFFIPFILILRIW